MDSSAKLDGLSILPRKRKVQEKGLEEDTAFLL